MQDDNKSVVFVSYAYPPSSSPGSVRISRLVKRLEPLGWRCHVVTVGQAVTARKGNMDDPLANKPERILRIDDPLASVAPAASATASAAPRRKSRLLRRIAETLLFPDRAVFWALRARRATAWARSANPRIVISTSPALSAHVAAKRIARSCGAKWIAEFRDPASWLGRDDRLPKWKRWMLAKLEEYVVKRADATVVVSEAFAEYFRERYPGRPVHSIPNGAEFEQASLEQAMQRRTARAAEAGDTPFVLLHAGELYGGARNPAPLIAAAQLAQARLVRPLKLRFIGADSRLAADAAQALGAVDLVETSGAVSHADSVKELQQAHALVALLHDDPVGRVSIMSKFFDYAITASPILVVGERIAMLSRIVVEHGMGQAFEYKDIEGMADWIVSVATKPDSYSYDCIDVCRQWSADKMASSMAALFETLR